MTGQRIDPRTQSRYSADTCPHARDFLENWIRWSTFCEKYQPEHCELAAELVREVAERNRKTQCPLLFRTSQTSWFEREKEA